MANMNKVFLIGNLTRDPELRVTANGTTVAMFSIAVNGFKEDEVDFIPIKVWKQAAEFAGNYLLKGSKVAVEGRLKVSKYQDKEGRERVFTEVIANSIEALNKINREDNCVNENMKSKPAEAEVVEGEIVTEDDIPF